MSKLVKRDMLMLCVQESVHYGKMLVKSIMNMCGVGGLLWDWVLLAGYCGGLEIGRWGYCWVRYCEGYRGGGVIIALGYRGRGGHFKFIYFLNLIFFGGEGV